MAKITYLDKVALNENTDIPDNNKVKANDMNEIKNVVNTNDANVGDLADLNTEDISNIVNAINEVNDKLNYSTEEKRIGTWLDGKPIYRKTMAITFPNNTTTSTAHGINNIDTITDLKAKWYDTSDKKFFNSNLRYDSSSVYIKINADKSNIIIEGKGTDWSARTNDGYISIYYTKTTD